MTWRDASLTQDLRPRASGPAIGEDLRVPDRAHEIAARRFGGRLGVGGFRTTIGDRNVTSSSCITGDTVML